MKVWAFLAFVATLAFAAHAQQFAPSIPRDVALDLLANLDTTVSPCDDFYQYSCGGWMKNTTIPSDLSRFDRSFNNIQNHNEALVLEILEDAVRQPGNDTLKIKIGTFYSTCMDTASIDSLGAQPLATLFQLINEINSLENVMSVAGYLTLSGVSPFFTLSTVGDVKGPSPLVNIGDLGQGGLGLFTRDYYLPDTPEGQKLLDQYQSHIANMLSLAGLEDAANAAGAVRNFETALAKVQKSNVDLRDPQATYNKIGLSGLQRISPDLPWTEFFHAVEFSTKQADLDNINIEVPDYFTALGPILRQTPLEELRVYLKWQTIHAFADHLSQKFVEENFAFFGKILLGTPELSSRTKRCVRYVDAAVGFLTGQLFVKKAFPGASKDLVVAMVADIENSFSVGLHDIDWMDDATRKSAQAKLEAIVNNVGFPDKWEEYDSVSIVPGQHFDNVLSARLFASRQSVAKVGKNVDKHEWEMTPSTVNAYYEPLTNTINFPAGIMQNPFFDVSFPAPMNFGGIGMVMGHELTHGFDDQGAQYDGTGRLVKWWDDTVIGRFQERTQCIATQYSKYQPVPGVNINGNLTLGENIADNGGIKETFRAYRQWVAAQSTPPPAYMAPYSSMTNDQLLFVSFAQTWCEKATDDYARYQVRTDVHSPAKFRVNGPLSNLDEFATAFACPSPSPMNPANKCRVW